MPRRCPAPSFLISLAIGVCVCVHAHVYVCVRLLHTSVCSDVLVYLFKALSVLGVSKCQPRRFSALLRPERHSLQAQRSCYLKQEGVLLCRVSHGREAQRLSQLVDHRRSIRPLQQLYTSPIASKSVERAAIILHSPKLRLRHLQRQIGRKRKEEIKEEERESDRTQRLSDC